MATETITTPGEQATTAPLVRRAADGLRSGLTGHAATALLSGSGILLTRGWARIAPDSPIWHRIGYTAAGGYVLIHSAAAIDTGAAGPFLGPGAAILWCTAAWIVAPPVDQAPPEAGTRPASADEPEDDEELLADEHVHALIRKVAGGTQGAHLEDLLATGEFGAIPKAELKALLTTEYGLPVESFGVRVDGRKRTRDGVRLRSLPPAPASTTPESPTAPPPGTPA